MGLSSNVCERPHRCIHCLVTFRSPCLMKKEKHKALSSLNSPLPNEHGSNSWRWAPIGNSPSCPSPALIRPHPLHARVSVPRRQLARNFKLFCNLDCFVVMFCTLLLKTHSWAVVFFFFFSFKPNKPYPFLLSLGNVS